MCDILCIRHDVLFMFCSAEYIAHTNVLRTASINNTRFQYALSFLHLPADRFNVYFPLPPSPLFVSSLICLSVSPSVCLPGPLSHCPYRRYYYSSLSFAVSLFTRHPTHPPTNPYLHTHSHPRPYPPLPHSWALFLRSSG